jgi:hypothetical protein
MSEDETKVDQSVVYDLASGTLVGFCGKDGDTHMCAVDGIHAKLLPGPGGEPRVSDAPQFEVHSMLAPHPSSAAHTPAWEPAMIMIMLIHSLPPLLPLPGRCLIFLDFRFVADGKYQQILEAFQTMKKAGYARIMVVNPLHAGLPKLCVMVQASAVAALCVQQL